MISKTKLTAIAAAIRAKNGENQMYVPDEMAEKIGALAALPTLQMPATAAEIVAQYEAINATGEKISGTAKKLTVEAGTWTPTADTSKASIPCSNGAKAFYLCADSTTQQTVTGAHVRHSLAANAVFCNDLQCSFVPAGYVGWTTQGVYMQAGGTADNTSGMSVTVSASYPFKAGTYNWTAYYWEG